MKLLAISGSPRLKGNTNYILTQLVDAVNVKKHEANLLLLSDYNIGFCDGCLVCEDTDCSGDCVINDDINIIISEILSSDILIFGSPSYFDMPTGIFKNFIDRTNKSLSLITEKKLRYGVVVVGQTDTNSLDFVYECIKRYCDICEMTEIDNSHIQVIARDEGDAEEQKKQIENKIQKMLNSIENLK